MITAWLHGGEHDDKRIQVPPARRGEGPPPHVLIHVEPAPQEQATDLLEVSSRTSARFLVAMYELAQRGPGCWHYQHVSTE